MGSSGYGKFFFSGPVFASKVLDTEVATIEFLLDILISSQYSEALIELLSDSFLSIANVKQKILSGYWNQLHIIFSVFLGNIMISLIIFLRKGHTGLLHLSVGYNVYILGNNSFYKIG